MRTRNWFKLLAISVVVSACGGDSSNKTEEPKQSESAASSTPSNAATAQASSGASSSSEPVQPKLSFEDAVKRYVSESAAALTGKDAKRYTALYTPAAVVAVTGPKGWQETPVSEMDKILTGYFTGFPDLAFKYTRVLASGRYAIAEWVLTGTNKGDFMGKKPTNKKVGYRGASVLTFTEDGRVQRESSYFDMGTIMGQLGLDPQGGKVRAVEALPTKDPEIVFGKDGSDAPARGWYTAADKGDSKGLLAQATDDILVSNQYMPSDTKGKKEVEKELAGGNKAFVDQKTEVVMCVAVGSVIGCELAWTATWKGDAMGMKATGKKGMVHSLEVLELKDAKVAKTVAYANGLEFAGTFGLMDPPPSSK
ncbi:MAG: ester cyclase [Polyangiaceae bacterium]